MRLRRQRITHSWVNKLLAGILLVALAVTTLPMVSWAEESHREPKNIEALIEMDGSVKVYQNDGATLINPEANGGYNNVPLDAKVRIDFAFEFGGFEDGDDFYIKDDFFTIPLPSGLTFTEGNIYELNGTEENTNSPIKIGNVEIVNNDGKFEAVVKLTPPEGVQITEGNFGLLGSFVESEGGSENEVVIKFSEEKIIKITPKQKDDDGDPGTEPGTNPGTPDPTHTINKTYQGYDKTTQEATWRITVKLVEPASNVVIKDKLTSNNHAFITSPDSFSITSTNEFSGSYSYNHDTLTYTFSGEVPTGEYTLTYKTKVNEDAFNQPEGTGIQLGNTATLEIEEEVIDTSIILNTVDTVDWISKSGAFINGNGVNTDAIEWSITVNSNYKAITGAIITDSLPQWLAYDLNSLKVYNKENQLVTTADFVSATTSGNPEDEAGSTVKFTFSEVISEPYTIKFKTLVVNPSDYYSNTATSYTNSATLGGSGVPGNAGGTGTIPGATSNGVGIPTNVISKSVDAATYDDLRGTYVIPWKITINSNKITIKDATITDTLPAGVNLDKTTFKVVKADSPTEELVGGTLTYEDGDTTFTYKFPGDITEAYVITYETNVSNRSLLANNDSYTFGNSVDLAGKSSDNKDVTGSSNISTTLNNEMIKKTFVSYDYVTRIAEWKIVVNQKKLLLNNVKVTDNLPAGVKLLEEGFSVVKNGSPDTVVATAPTTPSSFNNEATIFEYAFDASIKDQYTITFRTQVDEAVFVKDDNLNKAIRFENSAKVEATEATTGNRESKDSHEVRNNIVVKGYEYENFSDFIDWSIQINENRATLTDITLLDVLQSELKLIPETVRLYKLVLASNGTLQKESDPISRELYTVEYAEATGEFKIVLGDISDAYQLDFTTDVISKNQFQLDNKVTISGEGIAKIGESNKKDVQVDESWAGGSGTSGKVTVRKIDSKTKELLPNATLHFYKRVNEKKPTEKVSMADSPVEFDKLSFMAYYLKEVNAPEGYLLDTTEYKIRLSKAEPTVVFTLENTKATADLTFTKTNNSGTVLPGAEFGLYNEAGTLIKTTKSDASGIVKFEAVEYGKYTIKELNAPSGYIKSDVVLQAEVTVDTVNNIGVGTVTPNTVTNAPVPPGQTNPPIIPYTPAPSATPGVTPGVTPAPTPTPTVPGATPTPGPSATPSPEEPNVTTPEDTPTGGEVDIPDNEIPVVGRPPKNGTVTVDENGKWTYTPNPGYTGDDDFTIIIGDEEVPFGVKVTPKGTLPKTGEESDLPLLIGGFTLMGLGVVAAAVANRKKQAVKGKR